MEAFTPITPLQPGGEMFERGKSIPLFPPGTFRPLDDFSRLSHALSEATEIWDEQDSIEEEDDDDAGTNFDEDDESSEFEEESPAYSISDSNDARRSQATISTFEEVQTPHSSRRSEFNLTIDTVRSVEGPLGPHLFRTSTNSSDFDFDFALQLSPLFPKKEADRPGSLVNGPQTGSTVKGFPPNALSVHHRVSYEDRTGDPREWSAGEVAYWMSQCGIDADICDRFEAHDVTGAVLMDLNFEDLKELEIQSFGKRHQLWTYICELRGGSGQPSPVPTPFQDLSEVASRQRRSQDECDEDAVTPITPGTRRRRGRRNRRRTDDPITPAESVSIVAIEQLIPKAHKCAKGEKCSKWRKQQKLLRRIQEEGGFPISPEHGGHIMFTGDPGNPTLAPNLISGSILRDVRPTSEALPSVVASSDLLGPGEQPALPSTLQATLVQQLQERDPQDNVRQFLTFQHLEPPMPVPITPIDSPRLEMFPSLPTLMPPSLGPAPLTGLQCLPKLDIPRAASANAQLPSASALQTPMSGAIVSVFSPARTATASPGIYRFGTPASEMDVPVSAFPVGPDAARDMSRSVPPSMHYRDPVARTTSAMNYRRGPSLQLPTLGENEVFSPTGEHADEVDGVVNEISDMTKVSGETYRSQCSGTTLATSGRSSGRTSTSSQFPGVNHVGWMKKRRTRLLRHEWADHHFRLTGTQLAMHANSIPSSSPLDTLNIDDYAVACASLASNRKLTSRFRSRAIAKGGTGPATAAGKEKGLDNAVFAFQLVPAGKDGEELGAVRRRIEGGKVHHFAVRNMEERIDWMREMMLAKALKEKAGEGYSVELMREGNTPS